MTKREEIQEGTPNTREIQAEEERIAREEMTNGPEQQRLDNIEASKSKIKLLDNREEIREALEIWADDGCLFPDRSCNALGSGYCSSADEAYECLLERLTIIGLVIAVEGELPYEGLYLPGAFRHPNWLTGAELKSIMGSLTIPIKE